MKKTLPVNFPLITTYTHHTTCLSIISCHDKYIPWFLMNYIQLFANEDLNERTNLDFYVGATPFSPIDPTVLSNCPYLIKEILPREIGIKDNVVGILIECINCNYYIYTEIDSYYIQEYAAYKTEKYRHPIFIYGYDSESEMFLTADFFSEKGFRFGTSLFEEIKEAYEAEKEYYWGIALFKYNVDYAETLNVLHIKESLEDYLYARKKSSRYRCDIQFYNKNLIYGLDVLRRIQIEILMQFEGSHILDRRALPILLEQSL